MALKITRKLCVTSGKSWRSWLEKNHSKEKDIWLVYYKKASGKPRIDYNDAVDEALCFGWIDSTVKKIDDISFAQRFTPRRKGSQWSELNLERARRLIKNGKMAEAGLKMLQKIKVNWENKKPVLPLDIAKELKKEPVVWKNFSSFPESYKRIRISWISSARRRPRIFKQRLDYFLKMTAKNRKFGMVQ